MEAHGQSGIRHAAVQRELERRLGFLDELIDTLECERAEEGDDDIPQNIEEMKQIRQSARESYSRGELQTAWLQTIRAEYCVFQGRTEVESWNRLLSGDW
jgi:hypothetical protein